MIELPIFFARGVARSLIADLVVGAIFDDPLKKRLRWYCEVLR